MFSPITFFLTLMALDSLLCVHAGLWVVNPRQGSTCHGGEPCTVDWLDDGQSPLLTAFGVATVGLYTGEQQLVQTIEPVDVTKVHSLTFTPRPEAGPNSDTYYISFISTSLKLNNTLSSAFSPFFSLDKMTGSFTTPDPSATSSIPVPQSITAGGKPTNDVLSTITVGTLSTSSSPTSASTSTSASARSTMTISSSTHLSTTTAVPSTSTSPVSVSSTTKTSSIKPSGFSTSVLPSSTVSPSSLSLTLTESPSNTIASPSAVSITSALSSPSSVSTSGATRLGFAQGTGVSLALAAMTLVLVL